MTEAAPTQLAADRPQGRRRGCWTKLALASGSLLVAGVLAELVARAFLDWTVAYHEPTAPKVVRDVEDKNLGYELVPDAHYGAEYPATPRSPAKTVSYQINSDGFRDPRIYARPKPAGVFRIAILGDSFTFGIGVQGESPYPKVLERELAKRLPELPIEVMNCGVYGYNTRQEAALLGKRVVEYEPDMVFVCFYMNDVVPVDVRKVGRAPESDLSTFLGLTFGEPSREHKVRTVEEVQWWLRTHSVLLDRFAAALELKLRTAAYNRVLRDNWGVKDAPGWSELTTYMTAMPTLCQSNGIDFRLLLFPDLTRLGEDYPWREQHEALKQLCRKHGVPFYDLLPIVEHEDPASLQVHQVDHHPNERCHELVGTKLAEGLAPTIQKLLADRAKAK